LRIPGPVRAPLALAAVHPIARLFRPGPSPPERRLKDP